MATGRPENPDDERLPLDRLVQRLEDPEFQGDHPRSVGLRETSAHVNPLMLASADSSSSYVEAWRSHAKRCPACMRLFEYFGLAVE